MRAVLKRAGVALVGALLASLVAVPSAHAEPAAISGTITSQATGAPLEGCVEAYAAETWDWAGFTCTDGSGTGTWAVDGLDLGAPYKLRVSSDHGVHLAEWAQDASGFEDAAAFVAPATVDVSLAPGAILAGTLTVADSDHLPPEASVTVWSQTGDYVASAWPSEGNWEVAVPNGTYQVEFAAGAVRQWAFGKATAEEADPITAVAGETTRVDDVLPAIEETVFSGNITAADTGEPLDACVTAYIASEQNWAGSTCTTYDEPGRWTLTSLAAGTEYKFEVSTWDGRHVGGWAPSAATFEDAASYVGPATIDVALELGGTLSGVMLGADGQPQDDVMASIETVDGANVATAFSWDGGQWSATVRPGDYVVQFRSNEGGSQWAVGQTSRESATVFHVAAGETVDASDRFLPGGSVTGTIVSDLDGTPIAGACVHIYEYPIAGYGYDVAYACTDAQGKYTAALDREGTYTAEFSDSEGDGRFISEFYGDAVEAEAAQPFTVVAGVPTVVDASLAPGATISGIATDAKLGTPIAGVCPEAYVGHEGSRARAQVRECSDTQGRWRVSGLHPGSYALNFVLGENGAGPASTTWAFKADSQASADLVTVRLGEARSIRNVKVPSPSSLTGRIVDPSGHPIEGARVNPRGDLMDRSGECYDCAVTDTDGRYSIPVLASGTYRPVAYAPWDLPLAPAWSGGATSFETAEPITLKPGKSGEFSVQLAQASRITVEVLEADGSPASPGWIGEVTTTTGRHVSDFDVWGDHVVTTPALPAGSFLIRLDNVYTDQVVWFDGATRLEDAQPVTLGVGESASITMQLPPGG